MQPSGGPAAGGWGVGGVCWAGTPVLSAWLAPIFTVKPSKYLQPLWQLIAFDPVCRCESPAYSCFLKNSLFSHTSLIIQLLIVSKRKSENANSGPLSLGWCISLPPCRGRRRGAHPFPAADPGLRAVPVTTSGRGSGLLGAGMPHLWLLKAAVTKRALE